jgi:organic hydroperoxide reductase OsmC/OhrA
MSHYSANLTWQRQAFEPFVDNRYSRKHRLKFDGGVELAGSSSPHVVPLPMSDASAVDPEEMFVAALASCHMLWFLGMAAGRGYCVDSYSDQAMGEMARNADKQMVMTVVTLRPQVIFSGAKQPDASELEQLHHQAHAACYLANSVKTEVRCEPVI